MPSRQAEVALTSHSWPQREATSGAIVEGLVPRWQGGKSLALVNSRATKNHEQSTQRTVMTVKVGAPHLARDGYVQKTVAVAGAPHRVARGTGAHTCEDQGAQGWPGGAFLL